MFDFVLFLLIAEVGCNLQTPNEQEVNNAKVQIIGAYNQVARWRQAQDESDMLPGIAMTHVLGGEYHLLEQTIANITAKEEKLRSNSAEDVSMRISSNAKFYSLLRASIMSAAPERRGTCGSWIDPKHLVPVLKNLFKYVRDTSNKKKPAGKLITKYLPRTEDKLHLMFDLSWIVDKKAKKMLKEVQELITNYLNADLTGYAEEPCQSDLPDFKALIFLDERLKLNIFDDKQCIKRIVYQYISLETALKNLDEAIADEELLYAAFYSEHVHLITEQYDLVKRLTQNSLAMLSMSFIRDLIIRKVEIRFCADCGCSLQNRIIKFQNSIDKIRSLLPSPGIQCEEIWDEMEVNGEMSAGDYLRLYKVPLMHAVKKIQGIDDIFKIFSTRIDVYYRKPYIGIPFSDIPVKHGLWWLASLLLPFENCQQLKEVQIIRNLLEQYSTTYYQVDLISFEQCGLFPAVVTEDSVVLAGIRKSMKEYGVYRKFSFGQLSELEFTGSSNNKYEDTLYYIFRGGLTSSELSLDPRDYKKYIKGIILNWIANQGDFLSCEITAAAHQSYLSEKCASCDIQFFIKAVLELTMNEIMNYAEGRIYPTSYEKEIYLEARREILEKETSAFSKCQESAQEDVQLYLENFWKIMLSNSMKNPDVSAAFLTSRGHNASKWDQESIVELRMENSLITPELHDFYSDVEFQLAKGN